MKNDKKIDLIGSGLKPSFVFSLNENQINVLHKRLTESKKEQKEAEIILDPKNPKDMEMAKQKGLATPDGKIKTQMEGEMTEKAVSKQQQKGDIPKKGKAGKAAKEMTKKDVKDFASTKHKGLPKKVGDKKIEESLSRIIEDQLFPTMTKNDLMETISRLMNEDPTIAPSKPDVLPEPDVLPTPTKPNYDPFRDPDPGVNPEAETPDVLPEPDVLPKPGPKPGPKPTKPNYDPFRDPDPGVNPEAKKTGFNAFMNQVQKYNMLKNNF